MSLNDELTAIETVLNEYEKMFADGSISADTAKRQILNIADPDASIVKTGEWIDIFQNGMTTINLVRLKELKYLHPNDSRIRELGRRAATVAVATPCCPAPVSAINRRLPIRWASSA